MDLVAFANHHSSRSSPRVCVYLHTYVQSSMVTNIARRHKACCPQPQAILSPIVPSANMNRNSTASIEDRESMGMSKNVDSSYEYDHVVAGTPTETPSAGLNDLPEDAEEGIDDPGWTKSLSKEEE